MLGKIRRGRFDRGEAPLLGDPSPGFASQADERTDLHAGWDHTARPQSPPPAPRAETPLRSQLLSLFSDPRVDTLSVEAAVQATGCPRQDVQITLDAMVQSGELLAVTAGHQGPDAPPLYRVPAAEKQRLEAMFRQTALELGEHGVLARTSNEDALVTFDDETDEPRLPVTAGLLSLFLPGTGQLLNGDVGRASLVFAVWALAWITHLSPVWTFVCLYAGAEAFFTAKIRSMERKMAKEALTSGSTPPQLPPPKPSAS